MSPIFNLSISCWSEFASCEGVGRWLRDNIQYLVINHLRMQNTLHSPLGSEIELLLIALPKMPLLQEITIPHLAATHLSAKHKSRAKKCASTEKKFIPFAVMAKSSIEKFSADIQTSMQIRKTANPAWNVPRITFSQLL
jgi:hypothetical protein